ncbi:ATP-binding protein [Primorskyibacter flagellatus]|uniref:ATP-binding protein n=1 Tax=Primorskyibacter flagellatus TaxID=1387277 RepID=A0A917A4U8_9RHOB|nr:TRAP transporter fused permease subunit [Primorskyibacter flagellatus]GGE27595.1 ATP-binding protein [Primorskyibacter flagellatus]
MMRERFAAVLAVILGLFVLWTAGAGPFESMIQRAIFLALVTVLGYALYPLGAGTSWRWMGLGIDLLLGAAAVAACASVIWRYEEIMTSLPWATPWDIALTAGLVLSTLELGRRAVGGIFPVLVGAGLAYALLGKYIPGALGHRGFDVYFVTETLLLGDLGIWGMLLGVAATVIAAFVLFGSLLLHTGGGQAFMDLATRLGGRSPGGAAKIATIASGLFGIVSGSAVANVATTGNFTIPMMRRLNYPAPFAAAVEAVASTGGQIAPPIMGAAAFVMAEILGISYLTVMVAAIMPALLFYVSVFVTVHIIAIRNGLRHAPDEEMPPWSQIVAPRRSLPVLAAIGGLMGGILMGRSITTAAFYGIVGLIVAFLLTGFGPRTPREMGRKLLDGLGDAGRGMVIIGVLLAGAQVLVSMVNMTGVGVTLSSLIVTLAGDNVVLVAVIVGLVCLIMGMGLPTTAAYVLVAAVLAPAMTDVGIEPLAAHMFVFYFATLSVITPPVCVAVFVAAGIAQTNWLTAAFEAVRLAALVYLVPFLILIYPGLIGQDGLAAVAEAAISGAVLVVAVPALLAGMALTGNRALDGAICILAIACAIAPYWALPPLGAALIAGGLILGRRTRNMEGARP